MYTNAVKYEKTIKETVILLEESIKIENDIVNSYIRYAKHVYNPNYKIRTEDIQAKHKEAADMLSKVNPYINQYTKKIFYLTIITSSLFFILFLICSYIIIKNIARYTSPADHISRLLQNIIDKDFPDKRSLRKKDKLKNIHEKILIIAQKLK